MYRGRILWKEDGFVRITPKESTTGNFEKFILGGTMLDIFNEANIKEYRSLPFWSWNDKLDPDELTKQIEWMHEQGFGGFFMHARGGLKTQYLGKEWFECIRRCVQKSNELHLQAWAYDENGWPSGFAGGKLLAREEDRDSARGSPVIGGGGVDRARSVRHRHERAGDHIDEGSDDDNGEQPAEQQEQLAPRSTDVLLDKLGERLAVVLNARVQSTEVVHGAEEDASHEHPEQHRQPAEHHSGDRARHGAGAADGAELMRERREA